MQIILAAIGMSLACGAALLIRGWRGRRIDDHPRCRGCGYDLVASGQAANCPECGRDLWLPGSMRVGHRRKRPVAITLGTLLLLLSLGGGGFFVWSVSGKFNWYPYKPLWMLQREASGTEWNSAICARNEILNRLHADKLSAAQIDGIVRKALAAQSDPNATWFEWWGDFIEIAWVDNHVSDNTIIQYARTAVESAYSMRFPRRVRDGSTVMVALAQIPMRAGSAGILSVQVYLGDITLDDGTPLMPGFGTSRTRIASGTREHHETRVRPRLPLGSYTATSDIRMSVTPTGNPFGSGTSRDPRRSVAEFTIDVATAFEVVSRDSKVVERVRNDSLAAAMLQAANVRTLMAIRGGRGTSLVCDVDFNDPPMPVAFSIHIRAEGREWLVGSVAWEPFVPSEGLTGLLRRASSDDRHDTDFPTDATTAEVVLRPNDEAAEAAGILRIWDGEIVIKDVSIERGRPR